MFNEAVDIFKSVIPFHLIAYLGLMLSYIVFLDMGLVGLLANTVIYFATGFVVALVLAWSES